MVYTFIKMDLDTLVVFGAGSYLAKKVLSKIKFKKAVLISSSQKKKNNKENILRFSSYLENKNKIDKILKNKRVTVIFFNNKTIDNLIFNKKKSELLSEINENLVSTFENAKEISKVLLLNNKGNLIFINSSRALSGDIGTSGYSITKNGIIGLMKSFSNELGAFNVTSNCISLGFFESPLFDKIEKNLKKKLLSRTNIKKPGDMRSIVNAIIFLANSNYVTGANIRVDGGFN